MKLFKDTNNIVFAYELDGSQDHLIPNDYISIDGSEADLLRLQKSQEFFDSVNYQQKRLTEYPSIGDQLDALFKAGVFPAEMSAKIQAIKDKYPKG
jgi:hypothetical protein